jgi:hypothetical protein
MGNILPAFSFTLAPIYNRHSNGVLEDLSTLPFPLILTKTMPALIVQRDAFTLQTE